MLSALQLRKSFCVVVKAKRRMLALLDVNPAARSSHFCRNNDTWSQSQTSSSALKLR